MFLEGCLFLPWLPRPPATLVCLHHFVVYLLTNMAVYHKETPITTN